jgi:hypothetical protein
VRILAPGRESITWTDSVAPGQTVTWVVEMPAPPSPVGIADVRPESVQPSTLSEPVVLPESAPDSALAASPVASPPPAFGLVAERAAREFGALLETRDPAAVARRFRMSSELAAQVRNALQQGRTLQAGIWRVAPDSAAARVAFQLRADDAVTGDPIWPWTEFEIDFTRTGNGWQVLSIRRR